MGKTSSHDLDDDLALGPACFDIGQGFVGRFKREDAVHHGADDTRVDELRNLAQLTSVGLHEEKRVANSSSICLAPCARAQKPQDQLDEPGCPNALAEFGIG